MGQFFKLFDHPLRCTSDDRTALDHFFPGGVNNARRLLLAFHAHLDRGQRSIARRFGKATIDVLSLVKEPFGMRAEFFGRLVIGIGDRYELHKASLIRIKW